MVTNVNPRNILMASLARHARILSLIASFGAIAAIAAAPAFLRTARAEDAAPAGIPERMKAVSSGCEGCHAGIEPMHPTGVAITCVGCHGGNGTALEKSDAHVHPSKRTMEEGIGLTAGNAIDTYGDLMNERAEYVRFVNPGDLRVAEDTCGSKECHAEIMNRVKGSIMATSANVPAAVLYDNGASKVQRAIYGEGFTRNGTPADIKPVHPPTEEQLKKGALPFLKPLPRWEATSAPDIFRIFDRGNVAAGLRGRGTDFKIAAVYLNIAKTRLNDPALWLPGTNGGAGDYRQSGCTACHVLYANDAEPNHAAASAGHGNVGRSASNERSVPRGESGHPLLHQLTRSVPLSQCLTCHHHQGNGALTTYAGAVWHDQETEVETLKAIDALPGGAGEIALGQSNDQFRQVQFADFHGHRWNFRKVFSLDKKGNLLDKDGKKIDFLDPDRFKKAVHLQDIHLEKGMQCIDCHTERDVHGDGNLYGAMIDAIEIGCKDCHGTPTAPATLETTGAAAGSASMKGMRTPFGEKVFIRKGGKLYQRSKVNEGMEWEVPQLVDVMNPDSASYDQKAARAHGMRKDGTWGGPIDEKTPLAHDGSKMECFACHSSWNTNCYGCHLPLDLNVRKKDNHTGLGESRGYAQYNAQIIRTDSYTLGINGDVQGNKWSPIRSASAAVISAKALDRQVVVNQQPTISSCGLAGAGMTPNPPHTVRTRETKGCSDCHLSADGDNNAVMASLLGLGSNAANWVGDYVFVAGGKQIAGVHITEGYEPRPVIGSDFHKAMHPESFEKFRKHGRRLTDAATESAVEAQSIAILGEFALVAEGRKGLVVYDVANVANKNAAQPIVRKPTTWIGQSLWARTPDAAWVALPTTLPTDDMRDTGKDRHEPKVAPYFRYAFVADRQKGLVVVDVHTLVDGDPQDNRLPIVSEFNPDGKLTGAQHIAVFGDHLLVSCGKNGLSVVNIADAKHPRLIRTLGEPLDRPRMSAVQFRYAFVADEKGIEVLDVTDPANVVVVPKAHVTMDDARFAVPLRTYLYVANGKKGVAIVDITRPEAPALVQNYDADGAIKDATALTVAATNASTFAYVADGTGGLKIVSLIEPARVPGHFGFAPAPVPKLIATWKGSSPVWAVADGMKRDRFVDEAGNPIVVGGRIGSRPLDLGEMQALYLKDGKPWFVHDNEDRTAKVEPTPAPTPAAVATPTPKPPHHPAVVATPHAVVATPTATPFATPMATPGEVPLPIESAPVPASTPAAVAPTSTPEEPH
ncbi:MAG TPA: hypothetical protein VMV18_01370 [bacterium]|nr:hypothetical protein [bacterium]